MRSWRGHAKSAARSTKAEERAFAAAVIDFSQTRTIVTDNDLIAIAARVLGDAPIRTPCSPLPKPRRRLEEKRLNRSLFDKVWDAHVVEELAGGNALVFMDLVVAHEITTPQGRDRDRKRVRRPALRQAPHRRDERPCVAGQRHGDRDSSPSRARLGQTPGHHDARHRRQRDLSRHRPRTRLRNAGDDRVLRRQPHCTLGAFGAFALGIGTTAQAGAMLAGCLILQRPKVMRVEVTGKLPTDATAKDLALAVISTIGFRGGTGYVLEYTGSAIRALTMEERMTLCNMAIESGAHQRHHRSRRRRPTPILHGTPLAPAGYRAERADPDARYDATVTIDGSAIRPTVSWGINPGESAPIDGTVPADADAESLEYMDSASGPAADEHRDRPSLHRFVHQRAHLRSARGGGGFSRPQSQRADDRDAGLAGRSAAGRTRRAARHLPGCRRTVDALVVRAVPGHVDGRASRRARAASRRPTATSPAAWAPADACIWPRRSSSRPARSSGASARRPKSTFAKRCRHDRRGPHPGDPARQHRHRPDHPGAITSRASTKTGWASTA